MRKGVFVFLSLVPLWVMAEVEGNHAVQGNLVNSYMDSTGFGQNLKKIEGYYEEINRQLDKQMGENTRDPFEQLVESESFEDLSKPRFIPRAFENEINESAAPQAATANKTKLKRANLKFGTLPSMQFRGFMKLEGDKAGLLEIAGQGTFVVHEGDQVGLSQSNGEMVVRVVEINELNLIVEFGSFGTKVVVQ